MIKVFVARHPTEAYLLKGILESNGIPSEIRGEALFGVQGQIPITEALPEIWVLNDEQADDALALLRSQSTDSTAVHTGWSWRCPNCGETIEPQFTACWQCNTEKPNLR